jgi:dTDP-4-dehydrorhamnose 3,5-epimerase
MHYQPKRTQGKLVRVTAGAVFDVAVDLRKNSSTYGKWVGVELSSENHKQLWIPPALPMAYWFSLKRLSSCIKSPTIKIPVAKFACPGAIQR